MRVSLLLSSVLCALSTVSASVVRRNNDFITAEGTQFKLNGKEFAFLGTNVYWLSTLVNDNDITKTLQNIKSQGIKVVRTWGFNDVTEIPTDGTTWFQLIKDGHQTINTGPDGLQKLDKIVKVAEELGLYVQISLTNNWNPVKNEKPHKGKDGLVKRHNDARPRNSLSNDYGGMDAYVREFGCFGEHSEFYTNRTIVEKFKWYTTQIVQRYKDSKAIFGWEITNDARCASSLPASKDCNTFTVTDWVDELAKHIKSVDGKHLVTAGVHGFLCKSCPKRFTKKQSRSMFERQFNPAPNSAFDGSFGVDSEDIMNSPHIDAGSFQLFPDMNNYVPTDPNQDDVQQALAIGKAWTETQAGVSQTVGKPTFSAAFGLVTQENLPFFVPVNGTEPLGRTDLKKRQSTGVSSTDAGNVFSTWVASAAGSGIGGAGHYQFPQSGLTDGGPVTGGTSTNDGFKTPPPSPPPRFA